MAGGKQSARQKMINLMYLVFIAMIAMTMDKEVLSAFSSMDAKFESTNAFTAKANENLLKGLEQKAEEKAEFKLPAVKAEQIKAISDKFNTYIGGLKQDILKGGNYELVNGQLPAEKMDKGDYLDEKWFTGDRLTKVGQKVMETFKKYKADIKAVLGDDVTYETAVENFDKRFDFSDVKPEEGAKLSYLDYNFQGFPAVASYAKLTSIQNDVKTTEANLYNVFLGNSLEEAITLKNYQAIVIPDKNAFYSGEKFSGKVVLGKYANVTPVKLNINGNEVSLSKEGAIDSLGNARLDFTTGNVGENEVKGTFTFMEKGEELPIEFTGNYVVVPRPNSATIAADKMNVVYRGVVNPMTISFAGVPDNRVVANAAGLTKKSNGKYDMRPAGGREVTINVTGTLDDGKKVSDKKTFRIKDLPKPIGAFNGQVGNAKLPRNNVEIGKLSADFGDDFDFKLPLNVQSFTMKVPGKPSVNCTGNRLNSAAKTALRSARRGDIVQFINIKAKASGSSIRIKTVTPVVIELAN
ncbi:gliding motility protein GldM [Winogradskyella sp. PC-19]|uniref:type IX secretion system motor protein PorM/GldM n=1 Tax=unclassified Winogradskyella TaxID=2615021 RepID=UPI000B3C3CE7|nr:MULTISPECIES: gliding motility protein GldM [unclassified Winogradskyella]ARV10322.1 gliding motility protein GldM [Winogradskyella sp. PC-19]RZN75769.1 MAG: gliding motility protein GldM [Winogradskyella sp.]